MKLPAVCHLRIMGWIIKLNNYDGNLENKLRLPLDCCQIVILLKSFENPNSSKLIVITDIVISQYDKEQYK